jgi:hypothetical protein
MSSSPSSSSPSSEAPAEKRSIRLRRSDMTTHVEGRTQGFRIKIEVVEANLVTPFIFVYQREPNVDEEGNPIDNFSNIGSPNDLEEYPVEMPTAESPIFFRLDKVDMIFRSRDTADDTVKAIYNDVAQLIETLNFADVLEVTEEITFE